jgi:hypothetical protein
MEKLDFFQLRLDAEVNQHPAGLAPILALIEATIKFFQENQSFFRIFIQERSAFELQVGAAARKELREKYLAYIDFVAHVMAKAIKKGDIQEFNPLEVAYSLVGILNSLLIYWTMDTKLNELGSKVPFIYDLFLKGAAKRKEKK